MTLKSRRGEPHGSAVEVHDAPGKRDALRDLRKLRELGEPDSADLGGFMIGRHSNRAIRQLIECAWRA